ncbi:GNAT family N-acetyltransferase [Corynebacterium sp. 320]|uniref:GNAT family N-acetyltransferase n=1 Tax=Corynebacterium TaxID=1716 RepID=UPI00125CBB31|nr:MULTISPECIES: N-acetyltransferase [Corynebacterium]KAB1502492.1 GNAT family N-acetyltransferase [Corynebacterium sp. 320]KAB1551287.1 GNAT family N-acetyltransferase [Corynebacterium sp. 321]KAB1551885.1 GNAT family N-acetyltransferase [Corynebacterium sp. 319]KAB3526099.1 GNAT family N-acetyltransferase [Corynebacterium sp. 250]KAB3538879.1 GNAT family N-acetyltransferase [Corynebacterium sp. 366]
MTPPDLDASVTVSIVTADARHFIHRIDELIDIHLQAMRYPSSAHLSRRNLWIANAHREDFTCSMALIHHSASAPDITDPRQRVAGVAYCFKGTPDSWWYQQVARGLSAHSHSPEAVAKELSDYAELSEIHVRPTAQHRGIGEALLHDVLTRTPQDTVMLSTPEVPQEDNAAWKLYRKLGFQDVLRDFYFPSDPRPFGILRRYRTAS